MAAARRCGGGSSCGRGSGGMLPRSRLAQLRPLLWVAALAGAPLVAQAGEGSMEFQWSTPIFAYRVDSEKVAELNEGLLSAGAALRSENPVGRVASNRGGWRSSADLHKRGSQHAALGDIRREAEAAVAQFWKQGLDRTPHSKGQGAKPRLFIQDMWMNMLGLGDSNNVHKHAGSLISGVYYVRVPNLPSSRGAGGSLKFRDPRPQTSIYDDLEWLGLGAEVQVPPTEGLMLLWPSWLEHFVEPLVPSAADRDSWAAGVEQAGPGVLGYLHNSTPDALRVVISFNVGMKQRG